MDDVVREHLLLAGVRSQTVEPAPVDTAAVVEGALGRLGPFSASAGPSPRSRTGGPSP